MTSPLDPRAGLAPDDEGRLVDHLRGELPSEEAARLEDRLAGDPALAAARDRLASMLGTIRRAHTPAPDPALAALVAARVRDAAADEERAGRREEAAGAWHRVRWARLLAASVAVHVLVLGVLTFRDRDGARSEDAAVRVALEAPGPQRMTEAPPPDTGPWRAPAPLPAPLALRGGSVADPLVPEATLELAPRDDRLRDFAPSAALAMLPRADESLKRDRLRRLGFEPDGTLRIVRRGLEALARRQRADGSFPAGAEHGPVAQTALALLPFLAEGHASVPPRRAHGGLEVAGPGSRVVGQGVAWLRSTLFDAQGRVRGELAIGPDARGVALKALAEDLMLVYGRLDPRMAERRIGELEALVADVAAAQAADGSFVGAEGALGGAWAMWGLDAATRTGVVAPPADRVAARFRTRWMARAAEDEAPAAVALLLIRDLPAAALSPLVDETRTLLATPGVDASGGFLAVAASTGLLRHEPAALRASAADLVRRVAGNLLPTGVVREGDAIGDTALHLLALQTAYRTY